MINRTFFLYISLNALKLSYISDPDPEFNYQKKKKMVAVDISVLDENLVTSKSPFQSKILDLLKNSCY